MGFVVLVWDALEAVGLVAVGSAVLVWDALEAVGSVVLVWDALDNNSIEF
jgi:uncharacterized protein YheU (UPF0270 family)